MSPVLVGAAAPERPALHRFAQATAFLAFFVLFAGGMVTSTGSGLAVPDWPLANGQYFPPMVGAVFFEHGHRMIAGIVAVLTWALAVWVHLRDDRRWVRRAAAAAAFFIVVQAVLGGVTVLYGLPPQVSIAHACLGQALFCLLLAIAQGTSPRWLSAVPRDESEGLWRAGTLAAGLLFVQLILGATLRHTGGALAWHLLGAAAAFWAVTRAGYLAVSAERPEPWLQGLATGLLALMMIQLFLGFGALLARSSRAISAVALLPTAHQATGALILGLTVLFTLRAARSRA